MVKIKLHKLRRLREKGTYNALIIEALYQLLEDSYLPNIFFLPFCEGINHHVIIEILNFLGIPNGIIKRINKYKDGYRVVLKNSECTLPW